MNKIKSVYINLNDGTMFRDIDETITVSLLNYFNLRIETTLRLAVEDESFLQTWGYENSTQYRVNQNSKEIRFTGKQVTYISIDYIPKT